MNEETLSTPTNMISALAQCWIRGQLCIGISLQQQGKRLGVSHAALSKIKSRRQAVGRDIEMKLADLLFGGSRDKLLAAAKKHWQDDPSVRLPAVIQQGEPSSPGVTEDSVVRSMPPKAG
jgi:hypothetical protein